MKVFLEDNGISEFDVTQINNSYLIDMPKGNKSWLAFGGAQAMLSYIRDLISDAGKIDPGNSCHEIFIYITGHGFRVSKGNRIIAGLALYNPFIEGYEAIRYDTLLNTILNAIRNSRYGKKVKITLFIDSCFAGSVFQFRKTNRPIVNSICNASCGFTIIAGVGSLSTAPVNPSRTTRFYMGEDKDLDGDNIKGDIRDRYEFMKKGIKDKSEQPKLFTCQGQATLCSLDGPASNPNGQPNQPDNSESSPGETAPEEGSGSGTEEKPPEEAGTNPRLNR